MVGRRAHPPSPQARRRTAYLFIEDLLVAFGSRRPARAPTNRRHRTSACGASVRLGHKSLRTLMKRSSSWYLPGGGCSFLSSPPPGVRYQGPLHPPGRHTATRCTFLSPAFARIRTLVRNRRHTHERTSSNFPSLPPTHNGQPTNYK